jgi:hypothetical protein
MVDPRQIVLLVATATCWRSRSRTCRGSALSWIQPLRPRLGDQQNVDVTDRIDVVPRASEP